MTSGHNSSPGQEASPAPGAALAGERPSRFWLYTPFVLLLLLALAWSAAWFLIRGRVVDGLDAWLAAEAGAGRQWACPDRSVAGYPFRIEVTCPSLSLQANRVAGSLGRLQAVAQVYQPRHVIVQIGGPLRFSDGRVATAAEWRQLEASVRLGRGDIQRASLVVQAPQLRVTGLPGDLALQSETLNLHLRPNPARGPEGAIDLAVGAQGARVPALDALAGGAEPADLQLDLTATQAQGFADGFGVGEVERWREAGGQIEILLLSIAKGPRRLEAKGSLRLDDQRRPAGQLTLAGAGLEGVIATLTGSRNGGLLGALLGQTAAAKGQGAQPALAPLPPVRLDNGRVALGPFAVPNVQLRPLY